MSGVLYYCHAYSATAIVSKLLVSYNREDPPNAGKQLKPRFDSGEQLWYFQLDLHIILIDVQHIPW